LVQLKLSLLVTQPKFNSLKCEIRLPRE